MLLGAITFASVGKFIFYLFIALVCLMFIVTVHEFGHYVVGKKLGFKINEFAIGFGPAIFKHKSKKTGEIFSLRCLPLGGYCAFDGEESAENVPAAGSFNSMKPWKRILVFLAGAVFNFISALLVISVFFMAYGDFMPKVAAVYEIEGTENVLQVGDIILEVNGKGIYSLADQTALQKALFGKDGKASQAEIKLLRNGEEITLTAARGNYSYVTEDGETREVYGYGITSMFTKYKFGFFESIGRAFIFIFKIVGVIFATIGGVITGALGVKENLGGTITAIGSIMQMSMLGFDSIMYVICVVSASIATFNLLPLPALDGSKVVFTTIEWIRGKPINRRVENSIHAFGLIALFALAILLDIIHFFG